MADAHPVGAVALGEASQGSFDEFVDPRAPGRAVAGGGGILKESLHAFHEPIGEFAHLNRPAMQLFVELGLLRHAVGQASHPAKILAHVVHEIHGHPGGGGVALDGGALVGQPRVVNRDGGLGSHSGQEVEFEAR